MCLRGAVIFGVSAWALTETLGAFHALNRTAVAVAWCALLGIGFCGVWRRIRLPNRRTGKRLQQGFLPYIALAGIAVLLALTFLTAALSPPNSADALAYHMPRVVY